MSKYHPYCAGSDYCVFTSSRLHVNAEYGVSFITTAEVATDSLSLFERSLNTPLPRAAGATDNTSTSAPYRIVDMQDEGKGHGVVATQKIERGSIFMVDPASILAAVDFPEKMPRFQSHMLLDRPSSSCPTARGVAIPRAQRRLVRPLRGRGRDAHERPFAAHHPRRPALHGPLSADSAHEPRVQAERAHALLADAPDDVGRRAARHRARGGADGQLLRVWHDVWRETAMRCCTRGGFRCACALCSAPSAELLASDWWRARIGDIRREIVELVQGKGFGRAIELSKEMIELVVEEQLVAHLGEHYEVLARLYYAVRDRENTEKYARLAIDELKRYGEEDVYGTMIGELSDILAGLGRLGNKTG